jgi:hypothetical protein
MQMQIGMLAGDSLIGESEHIALKASKGEGDKAAKDSRVPMRVVSPKGMQW